MRDPNKTKEEGVLKTLNTPSSFFFWGRQSHILIAVVSLFGACLIWGHFLGILALELGGWGGGLFILFATKECLETP